jgi:hypothetical protein
MAWVDLLHFFQETAATTGIKKKKNEKPSGFSTHQVQLKGIRSFWWSAKSFGRKPNGKFHTSTDSNDSVDLQICLRIFLSLATFPNEQNIWYDMIMVYFTQISGAKPCIVFLYWLADRNLPFMDCDIH